MPDQLESSIQKATDLGALGIIVPTVDDAIEARDAARFSRYPPFGRRSAGGGAYRELWNVPGINYRATINDNMLVTVMIETLEGVAMANEIAATHGVDVIILGNNDLSSFSGWGTIRYQDAIIKVHDAALKAQFTGNAGEQYLNGYAVSATRAWCRTVLGVTAGGRLAAAAERRPAKSRLLACRAAAVRRRQQPPCRQTPCRAGRRVAPVREGCWRVGQRRALQIHPTDALKEA
jgi:hypothetical protein